MRLGLLSEGKLKTSERTDFGLPSLKKYPMPDRSHVKAAIRMFNHVDPSNEAELARNIKSKMKQYNISTDTVGEKNRLSKYLKEDVSIIDTLSRVSLSESKKDFVRKSVNTTLGAAKGLAKGYKQGSIYGCLVGAGAAMVIADPYKYINASINTGKVLGGLYGMVKGGYDAGSDKDVLYKDIDASADSSRYKNFAKIGRTASSIAGVVGTSGAAMVAGKALGTTFGGPIGGAIGMGLGNMIGTKLGDKAGTYVGKKIFNVKKKR